MVLQAEVSRLSEEVIEVPGPEDGDISVDLDAAASDFTRSSP
jgi:hypothetical protein